MLSSIEAFIVQLPPLLQFLLGGFISLAILKGVIMAVDYFEDKRGGE